MVNRRTFIRNTAIVTGGLLVSNSSFGFFSPPKKSRVIIIGAGFSGLAAAYALSKKGVDFVVLESRNRIGGRVHSHTKDSTENLVVELGAEWVGASHIRLQELIAEMGLTLENNQFDTHLIYKGKYSAKNEWDYSEEWKKKFEAIILNYDSMSESDKVKLDQLDWWRYLVQNGCAGSDLDIRELLDSTDFGETIRNVSAFAALAEYAESSPKNEMDYKIKGGNGLLAEKLADKIGRDKIKMACKVERIVQGKKVTVYCQNGETFEADKIICTAPTFAVRNIKWEPELPKEMSTAMDQLQYCRINKNPILFNQKFWKDDSFDMVTDTPIHYLYNATKNQISEKGLLISYTIGDKAAIMANQSDEVKAKLIHDTLSPHFGDVKSMIEKQTNYYWGNDEYSKGAYALYGRGQWFKIQPILKKPFLNTHFAGEHLADWQGFMEGAINTGEEAAELVS
jgi:monoamine oxidase